MTDLMNNLKKTVVLGTAVFFLSCGSSPKVNSSKEPQAEKVGDLELSEPPQGPPAASQSTASPPSSALSRAIKDQNDEKIFEESSRILLEDPKNLAALNAMALYNYKKGRPSAAEYLLNKAAGLYPRSSEIQSNLGLIYVAQSNQREAIQAFKKALQIDPQNAVAAVNLGAIYIASKDYSKAYIALENPIRRGWRDPKTLNNFAIALSASGRPERVSEAERIYRELIKNHPNNKDYLLNAAIFFVDVKKDRNQGEDLVERLKFVGVTGEARRRLSGLEVSLRGLGSSKK